MRADVADLVSPDPGRGTEVTTVCLINCLRTPRDETGTLDGHYPPVCLTLWFFHMEEVVIGNRSARSVQLACNYRRSTTVSRGVRSPLFLQVSDGERQSCEAFQAGCPGVGPSV